jgi:hypothetical protein
MNYHRGMSGIRFKSIGIAFICVPLIALSSLLAFGAVTYHFDWYCSNCSTIGMGSNGREGPFDSTAACSAARASLSASVNARGCDAGCFNPQPCTSVGQPDAPLSPSVKPGPAKPYSDSTSTAPALDTRADRVRRADQIRNEKQKSAVRMLGVSGRWRNSFSWYESRSSRDEVDIALVETCSTPDCARKDYPNRPVFRGRLDGSRLVGVVLLTKAIESKQNGRRCSIAAGEYPAEGRVSDDRNTIVWTPARLPVEDGCAPAAISLGTWRRG